MIDEDGRNNNSVGRRVTGRIYQFDKGGGLLLCNS